MPDENTSLLDESQLGRLSTGQLARLVAGPGLTPAAVRELAQRSPVELQRSLERVIGDDALPGELRARAAVQMTVYPQAFREDVLLRAAQSGDAALVRRAAEALGRFGGPAALAALVRLPAPPGAVARDSVLFARSLLAYRHGLEGHRLEPAGDIVALRRPRATPLPVALLPDAEWPEVARSLPGLSAIIADLSPRRLQFGCGTNRWVIVFDQRIDTALGRRALVGRPAVVAAALTFAPGLGSWSVAEYVFAHPLRPNTLELVGVRSTGKQVHRGEARIEGERAVFSLGAIATPFSPTLELTGEVRGATAATVTFELLAEEEQARPSRVVQRSD
jgi:hypothetical protein